MKVVGELAKKMRELQRAAEDINGQPLSLAFDPREPAEIEDAIFEMEAQIDRRLSSYARNDLVMNLAETLKEKYRQEILDRAAAARLDKGDPER
jgi:hypothetical protein